jgi:competence protein ComEA
LPNVGRVAGEGWSARTVAAPTAEGWTPSAASGPVVLSEVPELGPLVRASLARHLPPAVRGGRLALTWRAVAALAVVVALAVTGGAVLVLRGRPQVVAADQPLPTSIGFTPRPTSAAGTAGTAGSGGSGGSGPVASGAALVVEVVGRVRHPGVLSLAAGARVVDALRAAGGVLPGTDTTSLGLARRLVDGEQVRVGLPGPGPPAAPAAVAGAAAPALELNSATQAQLEALPGLGPVLAGRILAWRAAHGGFNAVGQLKQVPGVSARRYDALVPLVQVGL